MLRKPTVPSVVFAGWLIPGGGHLLLGRRIQAVFFFLTITITFVVGMFLADFGNISPERHGYYFIAHIMSGLETMVAAIATAGLELDHVPRHFGMATGEVGILYSAVAALLNVIVVMHALGLALGIEETSRKKKRREKAKDEGDG